MKDSFSVNLIRLPQWLPSAQMPTWPRVLLSKVADKSLLWSAEPDLVLWDPLQPEKHPRIRKYMAGRLCAPARNGVWLLSESKHAVCLDENGIEQESVDLSSLGVSGCEATDAPDTFVFNSSSNIRVVKIVSGHFVIPSAADLRHRSYLRKWKTSGV
jgi:hypothetical protein